MSKLKTILEFADVGVSILPLAPDGREPAIANGPKTGIRDPKTLRHFFQAHSNHQYGLVTGDGIVALSVDGKDAKARLDVLASQHGGHLPPTVTIQHGASRHYLFRGEVTQRSQSLSDAKGIKLRVEGAFIIGPGCILPSGDRCRFVSGKGLDEIAIAEAPTWLLNALAGEALHKVGPAVRSDDVASENLHSVANLPASREPALEVDGHASSEESVRAEDSLPPPDQDCGEVPKVISLSIPAIVVNPSYALDPAHVDVLKHSIELLGLRTPISVRPCSDGTQADSVQYRVVAGHARVAAMRCLGRDTIDAFVVEPGDLGADLWGTAENLDRRDLSIVEAAEASAKFDRLLEEKLRKVGQGAPPPRR
jgi:hypothetical protein